jgi:hypothetical protein
VARDIGGGIEVYVMRPGVGARREDLVGTLDDAPTDEMATVDEQRACAEAWRLDRASSDEPRVITLVQAGQSSSPYGDD